MESQGLEITRGLRQRDSALLLRLIEEYQHRLMRFLWHFTRNRQFAEDVFQETWLRVLERGHQYDASWNFETWLFSVARHLAIDRLRQKKWSSLDAPHGDDQQPVQMAASDPGPLEQLLRSREDERVARALDLMPARYREVLTLRFHEEMSLEEIARVQGTALSTVKSRLYRALTLLGKRVEKRA